MRTRNMTWTLGGSALILAGVIMILQYVVTAPSARPALYLIGELVWAVGVTAFAIGRRRYDSVVSRKPLGVSALLVLGWWPPINRVLLDAIALSEPIMRPDQISDAHVALGYLGLFVPLAAGLVASVQIARARIVPSPWRWAPLWVLVFGIAGGVLTQALYATLPHTAPQPLTDIAALLGAMTALARTMGLGVLALVLSERARPSSVQIFRSGQP
ncbi:hypothetical protein [Microbacterium sp. bgisy207]|uniref:hypothetical protein n=1 Tax=Microbacterium sp. bgisy207 TaxID=3413800 RepID=UPI003EBE71A2